MEKLAGVLSPNLIESLYCLCKETAAVGDVPIAAACVDMVTGHMVYAGNQVEQENNPMAHAECLAIRQMSQMKKSRYLTDVVLVSTVEPCTMCMGALAHARIFGLVYFCSDDKDGYFNRHGVMIPSFGPSEVRLGTHSFQVQYAHQHASRFQTLMTDFFKGKRNLKSNSQ